MQPSQSISPITNTLSSTAVEASNVQSEASKPASAPYIRKAISLLKGLKPHSLPGKEFKAMMLESIFCAEQDYPEETRIIKALIVEKCEASENNQEADSSALTPLLLSLRQSLDQMITLKLNQGLPIASFFKDRDRLHQFLTRCGTLITFLDLSQSDFSADFIGFLTNLTHFRISGHHCSLYLIESHLKKLGALPHLTHVSLPKNGIEGNEISWLAEAFAETQGPISLDLSKNRLAEDEIDELNELFENCPRLQTLNMSSNLFGNGGAEAIAENLEFPASLEVLLFANNDLIIDDDNFSGGVLAIASKAATLPNLRVLDLSQNELTMKNFELAANLLSLVSSLREIKFNLVRDKTDLMTIPNLLFNLKNIEKVSLSFDFLSEQKKNDLLAAIIAKAPHLMIDLSATINDEIPPLESLD